MIVCGLGIIALILWFVGDLWSLTTFSLLSGGSFLCCALLLKGADGANRVAGAPARETEQVADAPHHVKKPSTASAPQNEQVPDAIEKYLEAVNAEGIEPYNTCWIPREDRPAAGRYV